MNRAVRLGDFPFVFTNINKRMKIFFKKVCFLRQYLKSLDRLRGHPLFIFAHLRAVGCFRYRVPSKGQGKGPPERTKRAGAVSRTEDASGAAVGCPQSVESAVLRAFEDASRTVGGRFRYRISLPYRRSLFFTPNASEDASRTTGSLFEHRMRIPYHRRLFPVPNFSN